MSWKPALPYAILLQDVNGHKESKSVFGYSSSFSNKYVLRGTLLVRLSQKEVNELKHQSGIALNFKVLKEPAVKLHCTVNNILLLNYKQKELLLAIGSRDNRFDAVEKVEWAEKLTEGSAVYVSIPTVPTTAKGIVRYIGKLWDETGIKFGIELLEHKYYGTSDGSFKDEQYFECAKDCGVFVGLDRLSDGCVPFVTKQPPSSATTGSSGYLYFKIGDRVMAFDNDGVTVHGTVKWTGGGPSGRLVGIETDVPINNKKFGGCITGMYHMFTPSGRRGREHQLFLPFKVILSSKPENSQNQEVSITTQIAMKYAGRQVSDDIREQQAAALEKNKKEANKLKAKHVLKLDERDIDDTMNVETQKEILSKIKQKRGNIPAQQGSGTHHSQDGKPDFNQGNGETNAQQNSQNFYGGSKQLAHQSGSNQRRNAQPYQPIILQAEPLSPQMDPSHSQMDHQSQGGDISSNDDSPRVYQAADQKFSHQNVHHYICPDSEHSYQPSFNLGRTILQPGAHKHEDGTLKQYDNSVSISQSSTVPLSGSETSLSEATQLRKDLKTLEDQIEQLSGDRDGVDSTITRLHQNFSAMEKKIENLQTRMNYNQQKTEESIQRMEANVDNAFRKALDVQKSYEELQKFNAHLINQLSLTQQQLLGVQSMMTSSRLWVVSHDQFMIGKEIGRGAWATVHETTFRGATVAAKCLHQIITVPRTRQLFQREMEMALQCQHQNVVTFLGATLEGCPVILMELMDTSLRNAYEQKNIKDHQMLGILCDIASALHFLHTRPDPVIHRDVSSANVLLKALYNGEWLAKLGDLGTAKIQQQAATAGPGAMAYGAPEAGDYTKHSPKMDVYSYGILILETLTATHPFQMVDALKAQVQQQFPQYHQLVTSCTNQQSSDRPTMYDVIGQLNKIKAASP